MQYDNGFLDQFDDDKYLSDNDEDYSFPRIGDKRYFIENGKSVEYEFTEEGCWVS